MSRQPWRLTPRQRWWFDLLLWLALLPVPIGFLVLDWQADTELRIFWSLSLLQVLPLLWRRRHPEMVFVVIALLHAVQPLVISLPIYGQVAVPITVYSVARFGRRWARVLAVAVGLLAAPVAAWSWLIGPVSAAAVTRNALPLAFVVAFAGTLGTLARTRAEYVASLVDRGEQLQREVQQRAALSALEERSRIAREMHDVVAHALSVVVVQADGARYAAAHDPAVAVETLGTISRTGRESLTEMRRMLGLLRADDTGTAPLPGLADLDDLVEQARRAGTRVEAELPEPRPEVGDGVALTAYRLVQEALTNVRKHAGPGARVWLRVALDAADRAAGELVVHVRDDGRGAATTDDGQGHGLVGMRERVAIHDGTLSAGPARGGGFEVCARIPL